MKNFFLYDDDDARKMEFSAFISERMWQYGDKFRFDIFITGLIKRKSVGWWYCSFEHGMLGDAMFCGWIKFSSTEKFDDNSGEKNK